MKMLQLMAWIFLVLYSCNFFDLDNDLIRHVSVNHSVHPSSNYGNGKIRRSFDEKSGDKIFENIEGKFYDVLSLQVFIKVK